jgi:flagellar hook-basal body complex protein FliE
MSESFTCPPGCANGSAHQFQQLETSFPTRREHDSLQHTIEKVFDLLAARIEKTEENTKDSASTSSETMQKGLDKAEHTLQVALDKAERNLQTALEAAEKRVNEKFIVLDLATGRDAALLAERLHNMNQFRDQITSERALYVTRDQLDSIIKSLSLDIRPLQAQETSGHAQREFLEAARRRNQWMIGVAVVVLLGIIANGLTLMAMFMKH